jgi:RNA polymerase sigma-70 factor (ECF subfamily)
LDNNILAKDLVQNTFIKTWNYLINGGEITTMKAFLYRVLNNLVVDEYRKRKHAHLSLDNLTEKGFEPNAIDPSKHLTDIFDGNLALNLIKHLPILYRKVMTMRYVNNSSIKEISKMTHQTLGSTTVQLHRGLIKIRDLYYCRVNMFRIHIGGGRKF